MMTYLKHVGGKKHSDLKNKIFEEIQVLYEKVKSSDENFVAIGFAEDERIKRELNKKVAGTKKADSIKEESKEEAGTRKRKLGTRKKMKSRKRRFRHGTSEDEKENDEILDKKYPIIEWKTEYLGIKPQFDETKSLEESNLNVVIRSNLQRRYFSTLMRVLSIFDREDLNVVYKLMMDRYQNELEYEEDSTMALELIRFVKKLIAELNLKTLMENEVGSIECLIRVELEQETPLDLLGMMKRQHALSDAPSLLPRATSTITSAINIRKASD
ncbi:hypothetical protein Tco_0054181 [Tanacetum coccineum]